MTLRERVQKICAQIDSCQHARSHVCPDCIVVILRNVQQAADAAPPTVLCTAGCEPKQPASTCTVCTMRLARNAAEASMDVLLDTMNTDGLKECWEKLRQVDAMKEGEDKTRGRTQ